MGTIKIEFDLPEFEKELDINIIIRKDGEVLLKTSSPSTSNSLVTPKEKEDFVKTETIQRIEETPKAEPKKKTTKKASSKLLGGNLMGMDF